MKKTLSALSLIFISINAFANMDDCVHYSQIEDYKEAIKYCKPLADKNNRALGLLANAYSQNENGKQAQKYLELYIKNAKNANDDIYANYISGLGNYYYFGEDGAKKDIQKGLQYITKGAELGNATAQYQLGTVYFNGDNAPVNYPTAYMWYTISAYNGNEDAKNNFFKENEATYLSQAPSCIAIGDNMVAKAYLDGKGGLPVSTAEAKEYLEKAISLYKQSKEPTANELKYCKPVSDDLNLAGAQKLLASL
ncbi:tetratricopeptide repeat protein [Francisella philomiragia]|uniref:tetratricopeptide repeat protein n=1 Tax=Francisella philomiragia TaxID=28110 RepID=UPI001C9DDA07|nr:tetratricopeptide repeat protein [Francisella philomiragia]MBY7735078.1 sel1 repeat family protein [Francisella philomiragia]